MSGGKCGRLCPFSLGLALGLTGALAMILWAAWLMYYGVPAGMEGQMPVPESWAAVCMSAFWILVKGFVFGFFIALFYNLCSRCKSMCCGKSDNSCCDSGSKK